MKFKSKFIIILSFSLFFDNAIAQKNESLAVQKATEIVDLFKTEQYQKAYTFCDEIMHRKATVDRLQSIWESLATVNGDLKEIGITRYYYSDTMHVTTTKLKYKNGSVGFRLSFNLKWQICGLYIVDAEPMYNIPTYANTFGFYEIKIPFGPVGFENEAILTVPIQEKKYPCIIIIGGSGPVDKDLIFGPNRIYKDFAWGLANKGIATLRYDKRTKAYFGKIMEEHAKGNYYTIEQEYLADLKELVKKVSKKNAIDPNRIYLMGHSQGAGLMPLFLKQNKKVAGAIMAAGNYTSLQDLMLYQFEYLKQIQAKTLADSMLFDKLAVSANNAKIKNLPVTYSNDSLPSMYPFSYWNYLNNLNTIELAQSNNKPVLVLQGERDYQVPLSEYLKWKNALINKTNYQFTSFQKLNHLFLEGEGKSTPDEYFNRSNVPEYVIDEITKWLNAQPRK
ncbi:MAG: alpha/beta fold hydrolase [Bacteroidia bacterium]